AGSAPIDITVLGPIPRITSVVPSSGPPTGGTAVTISGSNLTASTTVAFGIAAATDVVLVNSATLTAKTPPGPSTDPPTKVDVVVSNSNGSDTLKEGFL